MYGEARSEQGQRKVWKQGLERVLDRGWTRLGDGLEKDWRRVGAGLKKDWARVRGGFEQGLRRVEAES